MQFKHPEILWALLLLLLPILIHLFQLRKFKKTPFTNVKFLQKVKSKSRKSNTLKKWLLLATRLLLLTALILAFAQPFFAKKTALAVKETVIYLDNSFSMQAKANNENLLNNAIQELLKHIPKNNTFSLFTNTNVYRNVTVKEIQNNLLATDYTTKQLTLDAIALKAKTLFTTKESTVKELIVISDFQQAIASKNITVDSTLHKHLVQLKPEATKNISIDSLYVVSSTPETTELIALLSSSYNTNETFPVSLYNHKKPIAKTATNFNNKKITKVSFSIQKKELINGKVEIKDNGLTYDNELFFTIGAKEKIKVTAISNSENSFLKQLFTEDEFLLTIAPYKSIDYSSLNTNNLIVLDGLTSIPNALTNILKAFVNDGGSVLIIPDNNTSIASYNQLTSNFYNTSFIEEIKSDKKITSIAFSHPLYKNVFEKNITNFQYPKTSKSYKIKTTAPTLLAYEDGSPFLVGIDNFYLFTASIASENSNFKNSPLIVPTLYNIASNSLKISRLYHNVKNTSTIDVSRNLAKDNILKIKKEEQEFIPIQQSFANKVRLTFTDSPTKNGHYSIIDGDEEIQNISFNYIKNESYLNYIDINNLAAISKQNTIASLFHKMESDASITKLWKWFIIFALLFICIEVLIQKYLK